MRYDCINEDLPRTGVEVIALVYTTRRDETNLRNAPDVLAGAWWRRSASKKAMSEGALSIYGLIANPEVGLLR